MHPQKLIKSVVFHATKVCVILTVGTDSLTVDPKSVTIFLQKRGHLVTDPKKGAIGCEIAQHLVNFDITPQKNSAIYKIVQNLMIEKRGSLGAKF